MLKLKAPRNEFYAMYYSGVLYSMGVVFGVLVGKISVARISWKSHWVVIGFSLCFQLGHRS